MSEGTHQDELVAALYSELRALARSRMARLPPGQTLQPTALVHEAIVRLQRGGEKEWNSEGHFFGAASEAMRQILIDRARAKMSLKRGGDRRRVDVDASEVEISIGLGPEALLDVDTALSELESSDPELASIVKMRVFGGLTTEEVGGLLGMSRKTVERRWRYASAQLRRRMTTDAEIDGDLSDEWRDPG